MLCFFYFCNMLVESQYFPCVAFWAKARKDKRIVIEAYENYQKRSYRNKCNILSVNKPLTLSIPLMKGKNARMPIREVKISMEDSWLAQHKQSIKSAYGNAAYFEYYWDDIEELLDCKSDFLYDFNWPILHYFSKVLSIELTESVEYQKNPNENDCRQYFLPKNEPPMWPSYDQVFSDRHAFVPNLSILDLLFCKGPEMGLYLSKVASMEQ